VSQTVIGLTFVAVGGSLPELATSIAAATRGEGDLAVGNIVGSNLFNICCILGLAALAKPIPLSGTVQVVDVLMFNAVAFLLYPLMRSDRELRRWEGAAMLAGYAVYVAYLFGAFG
jgi:cation:H+ antiporter